jgi:hypothetical protein
MQRATSASLGRPLMTDKVGGGMSLGQAAPLRQGPDGARWMMQDVVRAAEQHPVFFGSLVMRADTAPPQ